MCEEGEGIILSEFTKIPERKMKNKITIEMNKGLNINRERRTNQREQLFRSKQIKCMWRNRLMLRNNLPI